MVPDDQNRMKMNDVIRVAERVDRQVFNTVNYLWYYVFPVLSMLQTLSVGLTVCVAGHRCLAVRDPLKVS